MVRAASHPFICEGDVSCGWHRLFAFQAAGFIKSLVAAGETGWDGGAPHEFLLTGDLFPMSVDYESAYHCHCSVTLDCGVTIVLKSIRQSMTYRGLLEGVPSHDFNRQLMDSACGEGRTLSVNRAKPYLIPPECRDYFRTPGDMDALGERGGLLSVFRRRKPEWLPVVTCIADFECTSSKNPDMHASSLVIVWFQDEFALPISEAASRSIKGIDWHAHAVDFEY